MLYPVRAKANKKPYSFTPSLFLVLFLSAAYSLATVLLFLSPTLHFFHLRLFLPAVCAHRSAAVFMSACAVASGDE